MCEEREERKDNSGEGACVKGQGAQEPAAAHEGAEETACEGAAGAGDEPVAEQQEDYAAKAEEYYDQLLRLRAEFDNFRKRMARERVERMRFAAEEVIVALLPALDNLERALEAAVAEGKAGPLLVGVEMTRAQLLEALGRFGLARMHTLGERFDPNLHEAVDYVPSTEHPEGVIVEELQHGYTLHGKVIRPALVRVSSGPGPGGEGDSRPEEAGSEGGESESEQSENGE